MAALSVAVLSALACAGAADSGRRANRRPRIEPRDTALVHEECALSEKGATAEDINGDGRPDRRTLSDGPRQKCRALDFDFDGVIDAWVYLDDRGQLRRRENDYDRDGRADEVSLYRGGVLVEQQRATAVAGKLDTWHYFSAGKLARTERDSNGDDYIDQWWEYPEQRSADCPLIHSDVDGDGQPDPGATVDVCQNQRVSAGDAPGAAESTGISEAPTEVGAPAAAEPGEEKTEGVTAPAAPREARP